MKKSLLVLVISTILFACSDSKKKQANETATLKEAKQWTSLFNGKDLNDWDTYLGPRYDETKGDFDGDPIGLNNDPDTVFSLVSIDGQPAIRISGEHFGGISTKAEFENYHLQLEFKWGEDKWAPRAESLRDSGLLYHATGQHGVGWFFWMCSQELQIQESDCGDYWGVAGATVEAPATALSDGNFGYDPKGTMMVFGGTSEKESERAAPRLIKSDDGEKPNGQWNTVDLYCFADSSAYYVNGVQTMKLYHLKKPGGDHGIQLTKGKIQLQSEGAEVFYRNIKVEPISQMPN